MSTTRVALCALLTAAACGDDDDGDDDVPTVDAGPDDGDASTDGGGGDVDAAGVDASPNAFPEPIFLDPTGRISGVYAADPVSRRAIVYTLAKFDDEVTDNFTLDLGIVDGKGGDSDRIEGGAFPTSAVLADSGHLRVAFHTGIDPEGGAAMFNNQPFVYDVTDEAFIRVLGDADDWGGSYASLSGDGRKLVYFLGQAPSDPSYFKNTSYLLNLEALQERPGKTLDPLALGGIAPVVSHDGRMVVFHAFEALVPADTDGSADDVYAYDTQNGTFYLVSDGAVDPAVRPAVGDRDEAGYRVAYHEPPASQGGKGTIVVCQLLLGTGPACQRAAEEVVACPSNFCVTEVSIAPHGRWLAFGTLAILDPEHDAGALSDLFRVDLDALFAGGSPAPRMLTPTPPDYPETVQIRFNATDAHMNDDGSVFFLDTFDGDGLGVWLSPAY